MTNWLRIVPWGIALLFAAPAFGQGVPAAPSDLEAANIGDGQQVELTWSDNSDNETGFQFVREQESGGQWVQQQFLPESDPDTTSRVDSPGPGTFRYRMRATNATGASAWTTDAYVTVEVSGPAVPADLAFQDLGDGLRARLTWTDTSSDETGFELLREKLNPYGAWFGGTTLTAPANATVLNNKPGVGTYRYRIRALNGSGGSAWSDWVQGTVAPLTGVLTPAAPTGAEVLNLGTGSQAYFRWVDNSNSEDGYVVHRQELSGSTWGNLQAFYRPRNAANLLDTPGLGSFRYRVRGYNGAGMSAWSDWAQTTVTLSVPTVPSDLAFEDLGDGLRARLTWNDRSNNEAGFEILREKKNVAGAWFGATTLTANANATTIKNMPGPGSYRYRIRSVNAAGASAWSAWVYGQVLPRPPAAPTGLSASDEGNGSQVRVTWVDESLNETGFQIERQTQNGSVWGPTNVVNVGENQTQHTEAAGMGSHRYRVRAVNAAGGSVFTAWAGVSVGSPIPTAPSGAAVLDLGNGLQARVQWQDNSGNETGFEIERRVQSGTSGSSAVTIAVAANTTQHTDSPGQGSFEYRVRALNTYGGSAFTPWTPVSVTQQMPAAPTNLGAADMGNAAQVRLTWQDHASNETGFQIERQTQSGAAWGPATMINASANTMQYIDPAGVGTHRYRIRAVNGFGASAFTGYAFVTVVAPTPAAPTNLSAVDAGNRKAMLSWTDNATTETSFQIERQPAFQAGFVSVSANVTGYLDSCGAGTFSYRVRSANSAGSSAWTPWRQVVVADIPPAAPSGITVIDLGNLNSVRVGWIDNSDNETGFEIERQTQNGANWSSPTVFTAPPNSTSRDDNAGMGTHRYRVRAANAAGASAWTAYATVTLASGWTVFTPSPDTRMVYVSNSMGNDSNTGLTEAAPKKTIAAAAGLVRNGFPDWLLLRRGDTFTNESFGTWTKSGRSSAEMLLIGTYGTSPNRPVVRSSGSGFHWTAPGGVGQLNHVAIVGLHFMPNSYNGTSGYPAGISFVGPGTNFLVEDCVVEKYAVNFVIQEWQGRPQNVRVRRCVITDAFVVGTTPHAEGMYLDGIDGITVEDCVIDHNGWREDISGAVQTVFRHNVYLQSNCTNSVFRRNICTNGAATGVQPRAGGIVEDNVLVRNPVNIQYGPADEPTPGGVSGVIRGNAILESNALNGEGRGWGIIISNINSTGVVVENNIIANDQNPLMNQQSIGIWPTQGVGIQKATIRNNVIYKWNGGIEVRQPGGGMSLAGVTMTGNVIQEPSSNSEWLINWVPGSITSSMINLNGNKYYSGRAPSTWFGIGYNEKSHPQWVAATNEIGSSSSLIAIPDPNRNLATYAGTLGQAASMQAFLTEARKQGKTNWRNEYTAQAVLQYLRQGFMGTP